MIPSVAFYPSIKSLMSNPYWLILGEGLAAHGWKIDNTAASHFGAHWLLRNRGTVGVLHFHYVQQLYAYNHVRVRLRWVIRFARNLMLARLLGYRITFTLHNATPTYPLHPVWMDHLGHWFAVNLSNSVIVHCEAARRLLKRKFGRDRNVYVVPHPDLANQYRNDIDRSTAKVILGIKPEHMVFVFVGGIRPNKGIKDLILAFKQLEGADLNLVIAGKPWPPATYVEMLERLAKEDSRILLDARFVPDEELQVYLNAADVVVLPFKRILTSSSAILAMGFARPVVTPALGCLQELITEDVGVLYDPDTPSALLMALRHCQETTTLYEMGKRAQTKIRSCTPHLMIEKTLLAYGENNGVGQ